MRKLFFVKAFSFCLILIILTVGCQQKKMVKNLNGSFKRLLPVPCIYQDSSYQILHEVTDLTFDTRNELFQWGGSNTFGIATVKFTNSDRGNNNEIKMVINNSGSYYEMLPDPANVNLNVLQNSKIYINPSKKRLSIHIIVNGIENTYYYERSE